MPIFDTPDPISVTVEMGAGNIRIAASDRTDTVVEVRPSDEADESDVKAAQRIRVDYANGVLRVVGPKIRAFDFSKKSWSADVSIQLPSGSAVTAETQAGDHHCVGRLGECRLKTSAGHLWVERTGPLYLRTGAGHITADAVAGGAEVSTGTGRIQLGEIEGSAVVKNSSGETTIDAVTGDVRVRSAAGDITIDRAGAGVDAKTSTGTIRVGEVARGSVALATPMGDLEIGIAEGTAAWLDVHTGRGHVRNLLDNAPGPEDADETVEVRGRTDYGDITIRRP
ncbi:DUF4097 family beta strand repeat-containing protein [Streptomonospora sp. S1-112]|uniref:DUF4097 family beta strand repeat-containing protein n=1 Tax=Streptomonospora mangrovi TaxID=2883123 RepID=A0A9X3NMS1_9ACTN|nr:DUF4097 family beta strand repeat-containing protein [Streptomonospora mangrovi]MDA0565840.1 DUF4097 family beta strand repeat-containing protein [Streptomonospora mangrovi]